MTTSTQSTLLVTGAGGQLGRRVVELLLEQQAGHVIATTRAPEKLASLAESGAEIRKADFDDPASLQSAFAGAERMLLISTSALSPAGHRLAQQRAAVAAAAAAGRRLANVRARLFERAPLRAAAGLIRPRATHGRPMRNSFSSRALRS